MRQTHTIQYRVHSDLGDTNEKAIADVFTELRDRQPSGLTYQVYRLDDERTFLHVVTSESAVEPLPGLSSFASFQSGLADLAEDAPSRRSAKLIGNYTSTVAIEVARSFIEAFAAHDMEAAASFVAA